MKVLSKTKKFKAQPGAVFECLDDLGVTGMHMTRASMPMMGGSLQLEFLSAHKRGLDTTYRWTGSILWRKLDFTVRVTGWKQGREKTWETVGPVKMILYSGFTMHLEVDKATEGSVAYLSFAYEKPNGLFDRLLCFVLGDWYGYWCLNHMLEDAEKQLGNTFPMTHSTIKEV